MSAPAALMRARAVRSTVGSVAAAPLVSGHCRDGGRVEVAPGALRAIPAIPRRAAREAVRGQVARTTRLRRRPQSHHDADLARRVVRVREASLRCASRAHDP
jgi:hypothetical protein